MQRNIALIVFGILLLVLNTGCVYSIARYDGPYEGKIVDADTGSPIEGVVILGVWYKETPTVAGAVSSYYDAEETLTDKNGDFKIAGKGLKIFSNVAPMSLVVFKAGYEHISAPWVSLKMSGEGDFYRKIRWENKKIILSLNRWSLDERRHRLGDYYSPGVPDEKEKLLIKEINEENREIGR